MMRQFSLRRVLAISMLLLAIVPAALVAWVIGRAGNASVEELAGKLLTQVAALVQGGTESQLRQAHDVINGVFPERLSAADATRARAWLRDLPRFESGAFVLARHSPNVPTLHFANLRGEYLGVETTPDGMRIAWRNGTGGGAAFSWPASRATAAGPCRARRPTSNLAQPSGTRAPWRPRTACSRRCACRPSGAS